MSGIDILRPDNHDLYRRVQHLVSLQWTWERIADDVGLIGPRAELELCEWVLDYREPKRLPLVSASGTREVVNPRSPIRRDTERFMNWRKERDGARMALEAMGK